MGTKQATFRMMRFNVKGETRYVGLAWNYDEAVLLSTRDKATYQEAREELGQTASECGVELRWFEGDFVHQGGILLPA